MRSDGVVQLLVLTGCRCARKGQHEAAPEVILRQRELLTGEAAWDHGKKYSRVVASRRERTASAGNHDFYGASTGILLLCLWTPHADPSEQSPGGHAMQLSSNLGGTIYSA